MVPDLTTALTHVGEDGATVETQMRLTQQPHSASFVPVYRWPARPVTLHWREGLEDVAGNRVGAAFEARAS